MKRALYVPCFPGELGWELINYIPHVNHVFSASKFNHVHVVCEQGREALYPMANQFTTVHLPTNRSMGNNGPTPPANNIHGKLKKEYERVEVVKVPKGGCRLVKHRKFLKYEAESEVLRKWRHIPKNAVVLCVRGRKFGKHKNWAPEKWIKLCEHLLEEGFSPVVTGLREAVIFDPPPGIINLQDKTTMGDLMAIMQKAQFVIGQSTGPAHFASLCGVPHAIWGSSRLKERYLKSWNPHKAQVIYHSCKKQFECSFQEVRDLVQKMQELLADAHCV